MSDLIAQTVFISNRELLQQEHWTRSKMVAFLRSKRVNVEEFVNWTRCRVVATPEVAGLDTWKPPFAPEDGIWVYYRGEPQRGGSLILKS